MKIRLKTSPDYLYCYILILLLLNNWWGDLRVFQGIYQFVKPMVLCSVFVLILAILLTKEYKINELGIALTLISVGAYTSYLTGSKWTLYCMVLIAFARNIYINHTIEVIYKCMSIFIIISLSIFIFQYIFSPSTLTLHEDYTSVTKYSMTFIGANEAARYWIYWFSLFLYINDGEKIPWFKKTMISIITIFFYFCTYSDSLLLIILMAFFKSMEHNHCFTKFIRKYAGYSFVFLWLFCLIILKFESSWLFNIINNFTTGRLSLGIMGFKTYHFSIFGQSGLQFGHWLENATAPLIVDNAYYMIMIQHGIFYLILISFIFSKSSRQLDYKSSCCLIMYSIFALAENTILSPTAIFPILIAAHLSWNTKKYFMQKEQFMGRYSYTKWKLPY